MNYTLVSSICIVLLLNSSAESEGNVFDLEKKIEIKISFQNSLSNGDEMESILSKSLQNYSRDEIHTLEFKNVSSGKIFESVSFHSFSNLNTLTIRDSPLTTLPKSTFQGLGELRVLYISHTKLNETTNLFDSLSKLANLFLDYNSLKELPADVFKNLKRRIREIYLRFNDLKTLPKGIFQGRTTQNISLKGNILTSLEEDVFQTPQLKYLDLSLNNVSHIDKKTFKNLSNLEEINMTGTFTDKIKILPKELFFNSSKLQKIKMDQNNFTSLEVGIFHKLLDLIELNISGNELTDLSGELFEDNIHLQMLDLSYNNLSYLDKNIFKHLSNLSVLYLNDNKLVNLDAEIFIKLTRLSIFTIFTNEVNLAVAGSNFSVLHQCKNLTQIWAKNNRISKIFTDWRANSKLEVLDLTANPLPQSEIDMKPTFGLQFSYSINNSTSVRLKSSTMLALGADSGYVLILDRNKKCESDEKNCSCRIRFINQPKTIKLECTRFDEDNLDKWPMEVLRNESFDVEFHLANCGIESLYPVNKYLKEVQNRVSKLVLSGNKLKDLDGWENRNFPKLKELELHNNNFTTFDQISIGFLKRSVNLNVTLHQNPWECNCNLKDFYNFIKGDKKQIINKNEITCKNFPNRPISDLNLEDDDFCPPTTDRRTLTYVSASFALMAVFIFASMYYYLTHEIEIKLIIFEISWLRWLVTEKEVDKYKLWDAFVSYATPDEWFVMEELLPKLESGDCPYKLCVHQRDWLGGDYIPAQIKRSVEESCRTIVVMSPNFLNSFWGKQEFQTAYLKSMRERCPRILIILLEEIDHSKLDDEMKAYITTNTYLEKKDPLFWKKLRYALPHSRSYKIRSQRTHAELLIP